MVGRVGLVPEVAKDLHLRRQAADGATTDPSFPREPCRRVAPVGAVLEPLDAASAVVKGDGVEIDATIIGRLHDKPGRSLVQNQSVSKGGERALRRRRIAEGDDEIEIVVVARLLAEEGIDTPAAIQPARRSRRPPR